MCEFRYVDLLRTTLNKHELHRKLGNALVLILQIRTTANKPARVSINI